MNMYCTWLAMASRHYHFYCVCDACKTSDAIVGGLETEKEFASLIGYSLGMERAILDSQGKM